MSIIVSPQLNNLLFVLIGEKMLQADEDLAYRSHQPYKRLGKNVRELSDLIEQSVFGVGQALPPQVGRQYVRAMRLFVDNGGTNYLREFAKQLDDVGDGRVKISMDIMEAKWSIIAELVRLLIELAIIAALSFFTGGASSSQTATAKARSRVTILATLDQLLKRTHLLPSLSEAFDEAFQTFVVRLAMMTLAPPGRRPGGFDWKQIVEDGFFGAVTGMFHGAFESLTKNLGKGFRNILDGPDGSRFGKNNTKNLTDDVTSKFDNPPPTRSIGDRFVRGTGDGANE
ncbi:WXG100-like domain-containing protein, partial [Streptomyces adustus]